MIIVALFIAGGGEYKKESGILVATPCTNPPIIAGYRAISVAINEQLFVAMWSSDANRLLYSLVIIKRHNVFPHSSCENIVNQIFFQQKIINIIFILLFFISFFCLPFSIL